MSDYEYSYSEADAEPEDLDITFRAKNERSTLPRASSDSSEEDIDEQKKRIKESKKLAKEAIKRQETESDDENLEPWSEPPAPLANDAAADPDEEYRLWVAREVERLRGEIMVKARVVYDEAKTKLQKEMSDAELAKLKKKNRPKKRGKMKFMQKYYTVGGFTIAADNPRAKELMERDYTTAVGDDQYDKTMLPADMLVRGDDYGKKGQSKWTHLMNEDTTTEEMRKEARRMAKKKENSAIEDVHHKKKT